MGLGQGEFLVVQSRQVITVEDPDRLEAFDPQVFLQISRQTGGFDIEARAFDDSDTAYSFVFAHGSTISLQNALCAVSRLKADRSAVLIWHGRSQHPCGDWLRVLL